MRGDTIPIFDYMWGMADSAVAFKLPKGLPSNRKIDVDLRYRVTLTGSHLYKATVETKEIKCDAQTMG
jgi:hypothetical protein